GAVLDGSVVMVSWVAAPAVIVTVAELTPVSPVAEKLRVRSPAVPVIARFVKVAAPVPVVVAVSVPPKDPPPVAIAAVTVTPAWLTRLPLASWSWITGCRAKATPLCAVLDGSVVTVSCVPVPAVIVTVAELTPVSPVAEKLRVRSPAVPAIARLVKVATPVPVVVALRVPPSVPAPVAIVAVTVTPAWLTSLPPRRPCELTGCCAKATPLCAVLDGWVVIVSCVAAPAVAVALKATGDPAPVACTVCVPAPGPSVQVVAAVPVALLVDVVGLTDPLPLPGVHVTVTPATGLLN